MSTDTPRPADRWQLGNSYERYVGRWSRADADCRDPQATAADGSIDLVARAWAVRAMLPTA